jgi:hypothetical protein
MRSRNFPSTRGKLPVLAATSLMAAVTAITILSVQAPALAAAECQPVKGQFQAHFTSAATISGTVIGGLQADFDVVLTGQIPLAAVDSVPPPAEAAAVVFATGRTEYHAKNGAVLYGVNAVALDSSAAGDGHLTDLITFAGGTGDLVGASGHIVVVGHADFAEGTIAARYSGELCRSR